MAESIFSSLVRIIIGGERIADHLRNGNELCRGRMIPMSPQLITKVKIIYRKCQLQLQNASTPVILASSLGLADMVWGFIECSKETATNLHTRREGEPQDFLWLRNHDRKTALDIAIYNNHVEMAKISLNNASPWDLLSEWNSRGNILVSLLHDPKYDAIIFFMMEEEGKRRAEVRPPISMPIHNQQGSVNESRNQLPDIFCVVQVCLEGRFSKASAIKSLRAGHQQSGDEIPWKFCEQFQDKDFPSLSRDRIVRIATHPTAMKLGYGSAAIELLTRYFEGQFAPISEVDVQNDPEVPRLRITEAAEKVSLLKEKIKPRSDLPPLLVHLHERWPEKLHYLGVSFGLTLDLFHFWKKHKFAPFYICEVPNSVTGEQSCMMLKPLHTDDIEVKGSDELGFLGPYYRAFRAAFMRRLCSPKFNTMEYKLVMSILDPKLSFTDIDPSLTISNGIHDDIITCPFSMGRLKDYVNNRLGDPDLISDLKLPLACLYFQEKLPVTLSYAQASVLLCMGLQNQDVSYTEADLSRG